MTLKLPLLASIRTQRVQSAGLEVVRLVNLALPFIQVNIEMVLLSNSI